MQSNVCKHLLAVALALGMSEEERKGMCRKLAQQAAKAPERYRDRAEEQRASMERRNSAAVCASDGTRRAAVHGLPSRH
jgi:hypothetical protein